MDLELIESMINDNIDDFYFGPQLESSLLQSTTLNLEQTSLKKVNYQSYYLHFILGSILSLPSFPKLIEKLQIEDIFVQWQTSESVQEHQIKIVITIRNRKNGKSIVYRSFSFNPNLPSMYEKSEVTEDDIGNLMIALKKKSRKIEDYLFSDIFHYGLVKLKNGRPYRMRQEIRVKGENSRIFKFMDAFQTISSSNSPLRVFELPSMFVDLVEKMAMHKSVSSKVGTEPFIDILDHKFDDLDNIYSAGEMSIFLDKIAEMYQTYDKRFDMKFSASRIDHCAFIHGILLMNMKNRFDLKIHVENGEVMNHDTIQLIMKSYTSSEQGKSSILRKPYIFEFQDQGGESGALNTISRIKRIGYVKLLPHIQTFSKDCSFFAINLISPFARIKTIQVPLRKLKPDSPNSILELIRKVAGDLYSIAQRNYDGDTIDRDKIMKEFLLETRAFVDNIQSGKMMYHVPDDVRYLSRYIMGEAATSKLTVYHVDYSDYGMDYFDYITTFIVTTESTDYDVVLNVLEGSKSMSDVNMDFILKKSNSKLAKRLQVDFRLFPRHRLHEFHYSTDVPIKDFIDNQITVHDFYDVSNEMVATAPLVGIPEVRNLKPSYLSPEHPSVPDMLARATKKFLYRMKHVIENEKQLEAIFRGIFHKHDSVLINDNFPDQKSLIFADEKSKLIRLRFFLSNRNGQKLLGRTTSLKIHDNHVDKTYSILFNNDAENIRDTVAVVHDRGCDAANLEKYVLGCKGTTRVKRDRKCIKVADNEEEQGKGDSRLKRVFHTIKTVSSFTAHGMMAKDMIANLINGQWSSLAINVGLVTSGFALSRGADELAKIAIAQKSALSYAVRLGAPFLRRLTSGFVIYDLIQSVQNKNDENAVVNIVQDSTFLLVDTLDIGLEIAEIVGFEASGFLGPAGMAVAVAVWVGGDIYKAVKTVNRIDEQFHLDSMQKFEMGAKLFFHLDIESNIRALELHKTKKEAAKKALLNHRQIRYYITNLDPNKQTMIHFTDEDVKGNRTVRRKIICPSDVDSMTITGMTGKYINALLCWNALAMENVAYSEPGIVFMNVVNSSAQVRCSKHLQHVISMGNGHYYIDSGDVDDTFLVSGTHIEGTIKGGLGSNALDIGKVSPEVEVVIIPGVLKIYSFITYFENVHIFKGRSECPEFVKTWPELRSIDLFGGKDFDNPDVIDVGNHMELNLMMRDFTNVTFNTNVTGNFNIFYTDMTCFTEVHVRKNRQNTSFQFHINIESKKAKIRLKKGVLYFQFNKISGCLNQKCILKFKDNLTIYTENMVSEVSTNLTFLEIMQTYEKIHVWLKSLLMVQMMSKNTVIMFVHHLLRSNSTILHNDPSRITHFFQGPEENIFVINFLSEKTPKFQDVIIHTPRHPNGSFADVIDLKILTTVKHKVSCFSHGENIVVKVKVKKQLSKIVLKKFATDLHLFDRTLFRIGNVPMKIHYDKQFLLRPVPLRFNRSERMIIVNAADVAHNHLIYVERRIARYQLFHINRNDLLMTNDLFNVQDGKRGHNVTIFMVGLPIINQDTYPDESENVTNLILIMKDNINHALRMERQLQYVTWQERYARSSGMIMPWRFFSGAGEDALGRNGSFLNQVLFEEKWDLIINDLTFSTIGILTALKTNAHMVCLSTSAFQTSHMVLRMLPSPWSYSPTFFMSFRTYDHRSFSSRLYSFLDDVEDVVTMLYVEWSVIRPQSIKYHPKMSLDVLFRQSRLAMLQFPQLMDYIQPVSRDLIHTRNTCKRGVQKLELDRGIKSFIDDPNSNGTIVVAFGHMVKWSKAPEKITHNFLRALNELDDYKILWQFDGDTQKLPIGKHIKIMTWLPQEAVLNHNRTKLFITHGGLKSLVETTCAGVPPLVVPFFAEQIRNGNLINKAGVGMSLSKFDLTSENLLAKLRHILGNKIYKHKIDRLRGFMNDRIIDSNLNTMFWIEFLARHSKLDDRKFLRLRAGYMTIFQYFMVDIVLLMTIVILVCFTVIFLLYKH